MQFAKSLVFHNFHRCPFGLWEALWISARSLATAEGAGGVDPGGVPEQEAARVPVSRGLDLGADVLEGVRAAKREVLQPRDEVRPAPREGAVEVLERAGNGDPRDRARIVEPVLAGAVVGGIDHRVDGVEIRGEPARLLPDPHAARGAQPEDGGRDPATLRLQPAAGVLEEACDRHTPRLRAPVLE